MTAADASSLARWEWIETIGWLAVIVGCFGEGIAEFTKWPKDDEKRHKLGKMSWLILIAGLGLEFWGSGRVAAIKDLEVARLNKEAGDATRLAGEATKLAAELNVRATSNELARVELQKQVEVLRKANLDLSLKIQPRTISPQMRAEMLKCLSDKPKGEFAVVAPFSDGEARTLGDQLSALLQDAGYKAVGIPKLNNTVVMGSGATGIGVVCREDAMPQHIMGLLECFGKQRQEYHGHLAKPSFDCPTGVVAILIGPRF